jgi:hypothetical protein
VFIADTRMPAKLSNENKIKNVKLRGCLLWYVLEHEVVQPNVVVRLSADRPSVVVDEVCPLEGEALEVVVRAAFNSRIGTYGCISLVSYGKRSSFPWSSSPSPKRDVRRMLEH